MRTVLLIAFHFPPFAGSSGIQRTLGFVQHLPEFGWRPVVLSVSPFAFERSDEATLSQIPAHCEVVRVPCIDVGRHLSIAGRYPNALCMPDRWASWTWLGGAIGARACRRYGVEAVWSTYPIATAHMLGARVAQRTRLPWIADFRDPMAQDGYPSDPARWKSFKRIEELAARGAARMVFVAPSALEMYRNRYPETPAEHFALIENGYEERPFDELGRLAPPPAAGRPLVILHSGIVYPEERDPAALFEALGALKRGGRIAQGEFVIRFRASTQRALLSALAQTHDVHEFIEIAEPIPYRDAIAEMMRADVLLVMQGRSCNEQIPAKLYEYLRAGRPMLGLTDPAGDTGRKMAALGCPFLAPLESSAGIEDVLSGLLGALRRGSAASPRVADIEQHSRRRLSGSLARLLDTVTGTR